MISFLQRLGLVLLLFAPAFACAETVKDLPAPTNYVSDFAGVLSPQTTASLNRLCSELDHQAHAQIAVVTIKTLGDNQTIEDFATQLEDKWGVGRKADRGILVILAIQDRKRRIEVGYGLEHVITDQAAGEIGRAMVPYLQRADYDSAVTLAAQQLSSRIAADAGVTLEGAKRGPPPQPKARPLTLGDLLITGFIILLVIFFLARSGGSGLLGFLLGSLLGGGGRGRGGWGDGGGFGGGGGDGGGFGGFGGGSSGGGGASGNW